MNSYFQVKVRQQPKQNQQRVNSGGAEKRTVTSTYKITGCGKNLRHSIKQPIKPLFQATIGRSWKTEAGKEQIIYQKHRRKKNKGSTQVNGSTHSENDVNEMKNNRSTEASTS